MLLDFEYKRLNEAQILAKNREIQRVFKALEIELAKNISQAKIKYPADYAKRNFYKYNRNLQIKLEKVLSEYSKNTLASVEDGVKAQWQLGNDKADEIVRQISGYTTKADSKVLASMQGLNLVALDQFITRKQAGLNLSQRIWNVMNVQNKELLETYLASGITRGRSAQKISQDIRKLLNEPEKLFRRVRNKEGNLVLSKAAELYHPGQGVYRSSAKNALRLSATEINMAFHNADYLRRQKLPFVKGIIVRLSADHPSPDICDSMAGEYPSGFMFEGWHPRCICYTQTLLYSREEVVNFLKTGEIDKRQYVRAIPNKAKSYIKDNAPKFNKMINKPYFLEKNFTKDFKLRKDIAGGGAVTRLYPKTERKGK